MACLEWKGVKEPPLYCDRVEKNSWMWQTRTIVLTEKALYNIDGTKRKRRIPIELIDSVSILVSEDKK